MQSIFDITGENIRRLRLERHMTQEELAYNAGITVGYIGRIERCEINLTVKTLDKIADALGVETNELIKFND